MKLLWSSQLGRNKIAPAHPLVFMDTHMFNQLTLLSRGVNDLLLADLIVWNVVFWEKYDWGASYVG